MYEDARKLRDVPFEELRVGDMVISSLGKNGVITKIDITDDDWIEIDWEDGNESGGYHPQWGENVLYVGRRS